MQRVCTYFLVCEKNQCDVAAVVVVVEERGRKGRALDDEFSLQKSTVLSLSLSLCDVCIHYIFFSVSLQLKTGSPENFTLASLINHDKTQCHLHVT